MSRVRQAARAGRAVPVLLAALTLAILAGRALAGAPATDDPERLTLESCAMCHSPDMLSQQRLTAEQWGKVVSKMATWGPPIDPEAQKAIAEYLSHTYAREAPDREGDRIAIDAVESGRGPQVDPAAGDPARGKALYGKLCARCHGEQAQGALAPTLVGRPVLCRAKEWREVLASGRRRMPGFDTQITAQEGMDLLAWVRSVSSGR